MTNRRLKAGSIVQSHPTRHYRPRPRGFRRPRLLIIGCGDIGQRVARLLHGRWHIIGLARSQPTLDAIRDSGARALLLQGAISTSVKTNRYGLCPRLRFSSPAPNQRQKQLARWATHIVHAAPPPGNGMISFSPGNSGVPPRHSWLKPIMKPSDNLTRSWLRAFAHAQAGKPATGGRKGPRQPLSRRLATPRVRHHRGDVVGVIGGLAGRTRRPTFGMAPKRLVYISTTGIYGNQRGGWVDETTYPLTETDRARRRLDAEQQLRYQARGLQPAGQRTRKQGWHTRQPAGLGTPILKSLILRVPGIYAADRLPIERLKAGVPALLPEDDVITNHIHADDLARLIATHITRGPSQRIINAVDDTQLPMGDYFDLVADHTGLPRPPRKSRAQLEQELTPNRMSFMRESRRIANRRLKEELGFRLKYPTVQDFLAAFLAIER
ncbi:MAG: hypothetical protein Q4D91_06155 [Lautropia sp.]|nr:hypothetical protein [Lautropia sp.]